MQADKVGEHMLGTVRFGTLRQFGSLLWRWTFIEGSNLQQPLSNWEKIKWTKKLKAIVRQNRNNTLTLTIFEPKIISVVLITSKCKQPSQLGFLGGLQSVTLVKRTVEAHKYIHKRRPKLSHKCLLWGYQTKAYIKKIGFYYQIIIIIIVNV